MGEQLNAWERIYGKSYDVFGIYPHSLGHEVLYKLKPTIQLATEIHNRLRGKNDADSNSTGG